MIKKLSKSIREYKTTAFWWMGLLDRSTNTWLEDEAPIVDALVKNRVK